MKKILGTMLLLLLLVAMAQGALTPRNSALSVTLINQDPDPVAPGEYATIKFRVENYGETSARDVKIDLQNQYPFSLNPDTSSTQNVGTLGPIQKGDDGVIVEYKVRVAGDAANGKTTLTVKYGEDNKTEQSVDFDIEVRTRETGLEISSVQSTPEYLVPGNTGYLEIVVTNPSDLTVRDVTLKLNLQSADVPLVPYDGATTKTVNVLKAGEQSTFRFGLIPFSDAVAKVYKLPVDITFLNAENELETKSEIVGIRIGSEPDISISPDITGFYAESKVGTVTLSIINKGVTDIKFVDIIIQNTEDYEVVSSTETYIGNIDSDDFETSDYTILRKSSATEFPIVAKIEYKDAHNAAYEQTINVPIALYSASLWQKKSGSGTIIVIIIVLAIIGYFTYRHFKKKKHA